MPDNELCLKCKKPKESAGSGIVTQFIEICQCGVSTDYQAQTISICTKCNKRVSIKSGSMTQWIFGRGNCECEKPEPVQKPVDEFVIPSFSGFRQSKDETYLDLDSDSFPTERYRAIAELGKGAAGIVYLCRDTILNKRVAVKTLHQLTPEQLISFQEEAKATAKLDHPNIVKILDFGASDSGTPYMVMNYVSGISLHRYLKDNRVMDEGTARLVFSKLAIALEYAHSQNVFHRDLKPSNILLYESNEHLEVCLIDFGIAKVKESTGLALTVQNKTLAGTPDYMSPDPLRGEAYDTQSELYCLGCVMFEALVGRPPFVGETALEILALHSNEVAPKLNDIDSKLSTDISDIVDHCLQKDKSNRLSSMMVLADELNLSGADETEYGAEQKSSTATTTGKRVKKVYLAALFGTLFLSMILAYQFTQVDKRESSKIRKKVSKPIEVEFFATSVPTISLQKSYIQKDKVYDIIQPQLSKKRVTIRYSDLSGEVLSQLDGRQVVGMLIENCKLDRDSFAHIAKARGVSMLKLVNCNFAPEDLSALANCRSLNDLTYELADEVLIGDSMKHIAKIPNLKQFYLRYGYGNKFIDAKSLNTLEGMQGLNNLTLISSNLNSEALMSISRLKNLEMLRLSHCADFSKDIRELSKLKKLRKLTIDAEELDDKCLKSILTLNYLESLRLGHCFIKTENFFKIISKLPRLVVLELDSLGGGLKYQGMAKYMKKLRQLHVYELTDEVIEEVRKLNLDVLFVKVGVTDWERSYFKKIKPRMKISSNML